MSEYRDRARAVVVRQMHECWEQVQDPNTLAIDRHACDVALDRLLALVEAEAAYDVCRDTHGQACVDHEADLAGAQSQIAESKEG